MDSTFKKSKSEERELALLEPNFTNIFLSC